MEQKVICLNRFKNLSQLPYLSLSYCLYSSVNTEPFYLHSFLSLRTKLCIYNENSERIKHKLITESFNLYLISILR